MASTSCGCFHCLAQFRPHEIQEWLDEDPAGVGQTAVCPHVALIPSSGQPQGFRSHPSFSKR